MEGIWKPVPGFEDYYHVSNSGEVYSTRRKRLLRPGSSQGGYPLFTFCVNGVMTRHKAHRLVALVFLSNPEGHKYVRHLDDNPLNNHVSNLKWGTPSENQNDRLLNGNDPNRNKTHCPKGHPYSGRNLYVSPNGRRRTCRRCRADRQLVYSQKEKENN